MRLSQFNYLARYDWLVDLLNEIRPELFPEEAKETEITEEFLEEAPSEYVLQIVDADIRGQRGTYHVNRWVGRRGMGHLFEGTQVGANQSVVVKEYLLPSRLFNQDEAFQRQRAFVNLAGVALADGRLQDFRVFNPLEAIADTATVERCYLVTDARDASPTLRQICRQRRALSPTTIRSLLAQVLQTLEFLHQQKYILPTGQIQQGLVHGNLTLDSLLWLEKGKEFFVYLCDLALWERLFDPPTVPAQTRTVAQDLSDLGHVAFRLLLGDAAERLDPKDDERWPNQDHALENFIRRLMALAPPFESAYAARQYLLEMPVLALPTARRTDELEALADAQKPRTPWVLIALLALVLLGVAGGIGWWWWQRSRAANAATKEPQICCLEEVSAVPAGTYVFTSVQGGIWTSVLQQQFTSKRQQPTLAAGLAQFHPEFQLAYRPSVTVEAAIEAVKSRQAAFAVIPLINTDLPPGLGVEPIAYDALAVFVSFSYSRRNRSLPSTLQGQISLEDIRKLYLGQIYSWKELGGPDLPVRLYVPANPEALTLFETNVLKTPFQAIPPNQASQLTALPTNEMLRTIIRDFETQNVGAVGFAPLSQIYGQCSIYPLAVGEAGKAGVQPLVLRNGEPITPETDLCDRKGSYLPDIEALRTQAYPLAYPIGIVYLQDNSLPPVGQKFAELLQTTEGQKLLFETGLVPLKPLAKKVTPSK